MLRKAQVLSPEARRARKRTAIHNAIARRMGYGSWSILARNFGRAIWREADDSLETDNGIITSNITSLLDRAKAEAQAYYMDADEIASDIEAINTKFPRGGKSK